MQLLTTAGATTRRGSRRRSRRRDIPVLPNNITGLLRDTVRRGHQVRRQGDGGHTSIRDADIGKAVHAEIGIDDAALFARKHRTRRGRVELGAGRLAHPSFPVLVALDGRPGRRLVREAALQRAGAAKAARDFEALAQHLKV